jgi:hypothetical protein
MMPEAPRTAEQRAESSRIGRSNVRRGKSHERRIANLFTAWTGNAFRRRRVEGRDSTVIDRDSTADVVCASRDIHFSIETKCGKIGTFDGLLSSPLASIITKHWHQCSYDAHLLSQSRSRRIYPMLFFKPHPNFDWMALSHHTFKDGILKPNQSQTGVGDITVPWFPCLSFDFHQRLGPISLDVSHSKKNPNYQSLILDPIYFCRWRDFEASVDPASIFC